MTSCGSLCSHFSGTVTITWPSLPVDTSLSSSGLTATHISTGTPLLQCPMPARTSTVVVAEGIPPVACRLVDKIRKWEYINLGDLLKDHTSPEQLVFVNGQVLPIQCGQKPQSSRVITDILTWLQAFSVFSAILLSSEDTTKEEAAGLAAHCYLILQMSRDLKGSQWCQYDQSFREWAAAKHIRKWGELNFTIYGRCLATQQPFPLEFTAKQKRKADVSICFRWNDSLACNKSVCRYTHRCRFCFESHRAIDCSLKQKRTK